MAQHWAHWKRTWTSAALPWLVTAVVAIALFVADLILVETRTTSSQDRSLELLAHHTFGPATYEFFELITSLGSGPPRFAILAVLALGLTMIRRRWSAALTVSATIGAELLDGLIKLLVARPRPELFAHVVPAEGYSFPSGHATNISALGIVALVLLWRFVPSRALNLFASALILVCVILVGLSRVVLGVHYPTDVLGGYLLGFAWTGLTVTVFAPGLKSEQTDRATLLSTPSPDSQAVHRESP